MKEFLSRKSIPVLLFAIVLATCARVEAFAQTKDKIETPFSSGSMEISSVFGRSGVQGIDTHRHFNYGAEYGYRFNSRWTLLGEYTYMPLGSLQGPGILGSFDEKENLQILGSGLRYNINEFHRILPKNVVPYIFAGGGYVHHYQKYSFTAIGGGTSTSIDKSNGDNVDAGLGASIFLKKNFGIRPEIRWDHKTLFEPASQVGLNYYDGSVGIFYQFRGNGKKK
jgi:hypothetical protein